MVCLEDLLVLCLLNERNREWDHKCFMSIQRCGILAFKVTGPTLSACVRCSFDFGQNSRKPLRL
jgi:hypothetical protein